MKIKDPFIITFILLGIIGLCLIYIGNLKTNTFLSTLGGTLIGISITSTLDSISRKNDKKEIINILKNSLDGHRLVSEEKNIIRFRKELHYYYSSENEDGIAFWNYAKLDFSEFTGIGQLKTKETSHDFEGRKFQYNVEMFRTGINDPLLIFHTPDEGEEPVTISIFQAPTAAFQKYLTGFDYHVDWKKEWRLSPAIISFEQIFKEQKESKLNSEQRIQLQLLWRKYFESGTNIFSEFKSV